MTTTTHDLTNAGAQAELTGNLARYYLVRAIIAAIWVAAAVAIGDSNGTVAALLLVIYPAWDALANWIDAHGSGGLRTNPTQAFNVAVSLVAAIAVAVALQLSMNAVLAVFGIWAIAAGLAQLITGVRRWRTFGAQWAMILSGARRCLRACSLSRKRASPGFRRFWMWHPTRPSVRFTSWSQPHG